MRKLTLKQQAIAEYYVELGNASEAAIEAGYSKSYARTHVYKLLENASEKIYIENRMEELKSERVADQQGILEYLTSVLRGEQTEEVLRGVDEGA